MKAGGETLALLVVLCWVITYMHNPDVIDSNPLKERLGYNNPCVGLDSKPATYFAAAMLTVPIYFNYRAAWIEAMSEAYSPPEHTSRIGKIMTFAACAIYAMSTSILAVLFLLPPGPTVSDVWWHTAVYVQYIVGRLIFVSNHYYSNFFDENKEDEYNKISSASWCFLHVYTVVSVALPLVFAINYSWFDIYRDPAVDGDSVFIPWYVTMPIDYTWFICLALTTEFVPTSNPFRLEKQKRLRDDFDEAASLTKS